MTLPKYNAPNPLRKILGAGQKIQAFAPETPAPPEFAGDRARMTFDVTNGTAATYEGVTLDLALYRGRRGIEVVTFEFAADGGGVAPGNVEIDVQGAGDATAIALAMRAAFEGEGMLTLDVAGEPQAFIALQPSPGIHGSGRVDDNVVTGLQNLVTINGNASHQNVLWFGGASALPAIIGPQPAALLMRDTTTEAEASTTQG